MVSTMEAFGHHLIYGATLRSIDHVVDHVTDHVTDHVIVNVIPW